jgi:hypothetical protein
MRRTTFAMASAVVASAALMAGSVQAGVSTMNGMAASINSVAAELDLGGSTQRGGSYSTGFEAPFTPGWLSTQQGWQSFPATQAATQRPEVTGTVAGTGGSTPFAGTQMLRLRKKSNSASGTAVGGAKGLSPAWTSGETVTFSTQVKITANNGADYLVELADGVAGTITARVGFDYLPGRQAIYVFDDDGAGGFLTTDTGVAWTANVWKELKIVQTLGAGIKYYYDNVLIYDDVNGIPGTSSTMDEIAIYSDNFQLSESGYFDAVSVTPEPASLALMLLGGLALRRRGK